MNERIVRECEMNMSTYRYKVGLSFTGGHRDFVEQVCNSLSSMGFTREDIFYDKWHQARITVPNADVLLQQIYGAECRAVAVFLSRDYRDRPWTGNIEWRAIRNLINRSRSDQICLLRVDGIDIDTIAGLSSTCDIAADVSEMTPSQAASFICEWYAEHVESSFAESSSLESQSDTVIEYDALIELVYERLSDVRDALAIGNDDYYKAAVANMDSAMRKTYRFAEKYGAVDSLRSDNCMAIINQYNRFVQSYNVFASFGDRSSEQAQKCGSITSQEFNRLMKIVIDLLHRHQD